MRRRQAASRRRRAMLARRRAIARSRARSRASSRRRAAMRRRAIARRRAASKRRSRSRRRKRSRKRRTTKRKKTIRRLRKKIKQHRDSSDLGIPGVLIALALAIIPQIIASIFIPRKIPGRNGRLAIAGIAYITTIIGFIVKDFAKCSKGAPFSNHIISAGVATFIGGMFNIGLKYASPGIPALRMVDNAYDSSFGVSLVNIPITMISMFIISMINYRSSYCSKGTGIIGILASFIGAIISVFGKELLISGPVSQNIIPAPLE